MLKTFSNVEWLIFNYYIIEKNGVLVNVMSVVYDL